MRRDLPELQGLDAFEAFNRVHGAGRAIDPYPRLAELRSRGAVHKVEIREMIGEGVPIPPGLAPEIYVVVSYEAVAEVLRDGATYSSRAYAQTMGIVMGRTILEMDEPEHSRYRGLIQKAFTRKTLEVWKRDLIQPVVNGLIDRFEARGQAELVRELCFPFPVAVIAGMIGLPDEDVADFHRWAVELISISFDPQRGFAAAQSLRGLFARVLALRRRDPRDDLISVLAHAELDGTRLDDEAIFAFLRLLAPAGAETTYRSSSNLLLGLLRHPDQLNAVREDRSLLGRAIEEGLRWEAPLTAILRTATRDSLLDGVPIPAGATLSVNLAAANHDAARYPDPERFDLFRPPRPHMAFAFGPHRCLGMHLARVESEVVLEAVLDRLPNLHLDPEAVDVRVTGRMFRSPAKLPVCFEARGRPRVSVSDPGGSLVEREFPFPLPNGWFQVAYSDELAVGEVKPIHYFGEELVLFRSGSGEARVLDAYCPHLGAHLGYGGRVVDETIRCPFHAWRFDGSGECVDVPYARKIPPKARIRCWPVLEQSGFIMVWRHAAGEPPAFGLPVIPEIGSDAWTPPVRREWKVRSRNQELAENTVDQAHFRYLHGTDTVAGTEFDTEGHILHVISKSKVGTPRGQADASIDIQAHGLGFGVTRFQGVVDTLVVTSGSPIDEEHVHMRLSLSVRKLDDADATRGVGRAFVAEIERQFEQDIPIWEHKVHLERPLLCDGDGPIGLLRKWAQQFYTRD